MSPGEGGGRAAGCGEICMFITMTGLCNYFRHKMPVTDDCIGTIRRPGNGRLRPEMKWSLPEMIVRIESSYYILDSVVPSRVHSVNKHPGTDHA